VVPVFIGTASSSVCGSVLEGYQRERYLKTLSKDFNKLHKQPHLLVKTRLCMVATLCRLCFATIFVAASIDYDGHIGTNGAAQGAWRGRERPYTTACCAWRGIGISVRSSEFRVYSSLRSTV
jgi:hypothetical protein